MGWNSVVDGAICARYQCHAGRRDGQCRSIMWATEPATRLQACWGTLAVTFVFRPGGQCCGKLHVVFTPCTSITPRQKTSLTGSTAKICVKSSDLYLLHVRPAASHGKQKARRSGLIGKVVKAIGCITGEMWTGMSGSPGNPYGAAALCVCKLRGKAGTCQFGVRCTWPHCRRLFTSERGCACGRVRRQARRTRWRWCSYKFTPCVQT